VQKLYGGGNGIELLFNEQTSFVFDEAAITPANKNFADLDVCVRVAVSDSHHICRLLMA
jgi:hypothetical protein